MLGRIFLAIVAAVIAYALIRALLTGVLLIEDGGRTTPIVRGEDPAGFWTYFVIGILTIAFAVWVILL